jgi:hypothetical protein
LHEEEGLFFVDVFWKNELGFIKQSNVDLCSCSIRLEMCEVLRRFKRVFCAMMDGVDKSKKIDLR